MLFIINVSSILPIYIRWTKCLYYKVLWALSWLPQNKEDIYWIVLDNFPLQRVTNDHSILLLIYIDSWMLIVLCTRSMTSSIEEVFIYVPTQGWFLHGWFFLSQYQSVPLPEGFIRIRESRSHFHTSGFLRKQSAIPIWKPGYINMTFNLWHV